MSIKSFTIKRGAWARGGNDNVECALLTKSHKQCCLGFFAEACGVEREKLRGMSNFAELAHEERDKIPAAVYDRQDDFIHVNDHLIDDVVKSGADRERQIRALFKQCGITVRFQ